MYGIMEKTLNNINKQKKKKYSLNKVGLTIRYDLNHSILVTIPELPQREHGQMTNTNMLR